MSGIEKLTSGGSAPDFHCSFKRVLNCRELTKSPVLPASGVSS